MRAYRFLRRQAVSTASGGFPVLAHKIRTLLGTALAILPVLVIRAIRPVVLIQIGALRSERLGHFLQSTEIYLCERDAVSPRRRTLDFFFIQHQICNVQLKKMWDRTIIVFGFARWLDKANRLMPFGRVHQIPWRHNQELDVHGYLSRMAPHLTFTPEEERVGREWLESLGISEDSAFVCFHARDSAYLDAVLPPLTITGDWRYHDFRDSDIRDYVPAVQSLVERGYYALRMGAIVKEPLDANHPRIIDYATHGRTDFLDIYLGANCRFFICSTNGIYSIPMSFRRPVAYVNWVPLGIAPTWGPKDLFIPKKLWSRAERRLLSFKEILDSRIGLFQNGSLYEEHGIDVVENSPEEITALATEMDERLNGSWLGTEEDEELQQRFWSLFTPNQFHQVFLSHIGTEFLRQNKELLAFTSTS